MSPLGPTRDGGHRPTLCYRAARHRPRAPEAPIPNAQDHAERPAFGWEGADAVAAHKPSGWLVHNSAWAGPRETTLCQWAAEALGGPIHAVHRLDRGTSGLVLLARTPAAAAAWSAALGHASTAKIYLALVRGRPGAATLVDHPVRVDGVRRDAQSVVVPLLTSPVARCSLVAVRILTGRRHQVRQHLRHLAHPVLGDTTYGSGHDNRPYRATWGLHRLALHAAALDITPPGADAPIRIEAPWPDDLRAVTDALFPDARIAAPAPEAVAAPLPAHGPAASLRDEDPGATQ